MEFTSNFEPKCQYPDVAYTCECASKQMLCMLLAHWNWKSNQSKSVILEFVQEYVKKYQAISRLYIHFYEWWNIPKDFIHSYIWASI